MISKVLVQESVREGWAAFKVRPWPIIGFMAGLGAVFVAAQTAVGLIFGEKSWQSSLIGIVIQFVFMVFYPGLQAYLLKAVRKQGPDWRDFFWGWKYPVRIFAADVLSTLPPLVAAVVIGLAMMLVNVLSLPESLVVLRYLTLGVLGTALIWLILYFYAGLNQWSLLLIDKNLSAVQSVKQSWGLMQGHKMTFLILGLVVTLINLVGALALLVGLFVSVPFSFGIFAVFYVRISEASS